MKVLFYGGNILTMGDPMYAEAVLIEDGRVLALGSAEELRGSGADCEEVNLHGATLMPGFIDAHSHFFQVATSLVQVSLNGIACVSEIRRRIGDFILQNHIEPGQWVTARDYDNNIMPGLKNPSISELDSFAPDNPLVIHHKSGHMGLMNTAALKALGITPDTPAVEGGRIEVVDGRLTGYLEENAFIYYIKKIPLPNPQQLLNAMVSAQKKYASYGITTLQDGMVVEQMLPMYEMLLKQNLLELDVVLYSGLDAYQATNDLLKKYPQNHHLQSGGLKIFLDGSPQGRTAWMRQPYEGEEQYCGYGTMTDEAVEAAFERAAQEQTQILCHCNGDGAAEQFLRCLYLAEQRYPILKTLRPVIIHGQLMGLDQIPRAAALGAMISFFVAHVFHWGDVHIRNFGMERAGRISPVNSAMKDGVRVTFHQDAPVIEPDMLETVWCAVNRITKNGVQLDAQEKVSTLEALQAITVNAAYQYFQEGEKGVIAPGKRADFVMLDKNPLQCPDMDLRNIRVLRTYKDGQCVYAAE